MYEHQTFQAILNRMLDRVPNNVDKREGSIIYDALAPAAMELTQMYAELDINMDLSFADTSTGEYLERRTAEFGVNRYPATKAKSKGIFFDSQSDPIDVPIGSRFSLDNLNYVTLEKLTAGEFVLECETVGVVGNQQFGTMLPIDYIDGLSRAELADVLVPGEDAETDDDLRERYFEAVNEPAFGGNIADYKKKIKGIPGIGGVKVYPTWQGGGTVKCTIIDSDFNQPSLELVNDLQSYIDPNVNHGRGLGSAPIGHSVTIDRVSNNWIWVTVFLTLQPGIEIGQVEQEVKDMIEAYFLELRKEWEAQEELIVRVAQVVSRVLSINGVRDVSQVNLNDQSENLILGTDEIPVLSEVGVYDG